MDDREARTRLPQSDVVNLRKFSPKQVDSHFGFSGLKTAPATEKPAPVSAA
jgi:hypothetical protein